MGEGETRKGGKSGKQGGKGEGERQGGRGVGENKEWGREEWAEEERGGEGGLPQVEFKHYDFPHERPE